MFNRMAVGGLVLAFAAGALAPGAALAQTPPAWAALKAPAGRSAPPLKPVGAPPAAQLPKGEDTFVELKGATLKKDVLKVVSFAEAMHKTSQMWGRISGFKSQADTADWVGDQFRKAGLKDVAVQTYAANAEFWWPEKWDVRVIGGAKAVVLGSAMPVSRSTIPGGSLQAEAVFAGEAGATSTEGVKGKIAVQHSRPTGGAYYDRAKVRDSGKALIDAGAVAVINWIEQAGNMTVYDFGGCGGPCFNIGGEDGKYLTDAIAAAKASGVSGPQLRLALTESVKTDLTAKNVIGFLPGASDEIVVINAHLDAWFDGAGDNADGVAVLLALARHFAKPGNKPARTLMFVGSGGHHSPGLNGPGHLVEMNGPLLKRAVLVVNLEHVAQFKIDAVPAWKPNTYEQAKDFGVSNMSPYLVQLAKDAAKTYGFVLSPEITNSVPGDLGGYRPLNVALIQAIQSGPLYHTSGDLPDSISEPGLEKAAHFYAHFVSEAAKADGKQINP